MSNKAEIVITALDRASAVINRISEKFEEMGRPLQRVQDQMGNVQKAFSRLNDSSGFAKATGAARAFGGDVAKVSVGGGAALGALGFAFAKFESQVGGFADAMANAGVKGAGLANMQAAADAMVSFGVKSEDASAAMIKLAQNQSLARSGNEQLIEAFAAAGINMKQLRDLKPDELFSQLSENFSKSEKSGAKLAVATTLMGKSSTKMVDAMSQSPEALAAWKQKFRAALLSQKEFEDLGAAGDKLDSLGFLFNRIGQKLAAVAAPKLTPILESLEAKLLNKLPAMLDGFGRMIDKINSEKVEKFFGDVSRAFEKVAWVFEKVHGLLGTTGSVLAVVALAFAPTIAATVSLAATTAGLLTPAFLKLGAVTFPLVGKAFMALSSIFMANPIDLLPNLVRNRHRVCG